MSSIMADSCADDDCADSCEHLRPGLARTADPRKAFDGMESGDTSGQCIKRSKREADRR